MGFLAKNGRSTPNTCSRVEAESHDFSLWDLAEASLQTNPNQIVGIYMIYNDIVYLECFIPYIYHLELLLVAGRGLPSRSDFDVGNLRY